jgi:hypothetical protein
MGCKGVDWNELPQDRVLQWIFVNTVQKGSKHKVGSFLNSWETVTFPRRTLLHRVTQNLQYLYDNNSQLLLHYNNMMIYNVLEYFYVTCYTKQSHIRTYQMPTSLFMFVQQTLHYSIYNNTIFSTGNKVLVLLSELTSLVTFVYQKEGTDNWQNQLQLLTHPFMSPCFCACIYMWYDTQSGHKLVDSLEGL